MAATESLRRLRLVSVATFRATTFLIGIALWLHLRGRLPDILRELDTLSGMLAFGAFWIATCIASRIGFRLERDLDERRSAEGHWASTTVAGCWNGAFVFVSVLLFRVLTMSVQHGAGGAVLTVPFFALFGGVVAFGFGGVFGAFYGVVETLLFRLGRLITAELRT